MDIHKNFARSTLASGIAASAASFTVAAGEGTKFPSGTQYVTIWNSTDYACADLDPNKEIKRVSSRSTDTFTISSHGQGGTSDVAHNTGGKTYTVQQCLIGEEFDSVLRRATSTTPRRWRQSQAASGVTGQMQGLGINHSANGTVSAAAITATEPAMANYATAATTGTSAGFGTNGAAIVRTGRNIYFAALVKCQESAQMRVWVAMTDRSFSTLLGTDTPGGNGSAGFRFSTIAGDTNWQCWTNNGATTGTTDSGVAFDTAIHLFEIQFDDVASEVRFYIDGALVATRTGASIPPSGINLFPSAGVLTNENVAKNIRVAFIHCEDDL